ncbi:MAG: PorP/SprF family type IX secretion system membrane protein [Flavobacteriaceae bacterium]
MKNQVFFYFLCMFVSLSWSQQDVQYTHYMYNMSVINPAYSTGSHGAANLGVLYRRQWVGVEGSPSSASLFAHAPLGNNVEAGFTLQTDDIGDIIKEHNLSLDFAYKLRVSRFSTLSFGMKAGINVFNTNFSNLNFESGDFTSDPNFNENINNTFVNIGVGAFYYTRNFYLGLSMPSLLNTEYLSKTNGLYEIAEERHIFLTSGYVYQLNKTLKLKPNVMLKAVSGAPLIVDVNLNALYNEKVEFGLGYRLDDAFVAMINLRVNERLRIGYSYDYTSTKLNAFSNGSHEMLLIYNLNLYSKGFNKSPRFF